MIQDCQFDAARDVQRVVPDGALDLAAAFAQGSVPADISSAQTDYNGIEDPASIAGKPADVFEAMSAGKVIESRGKKPDTQE